MLSNDRGNTRFSAVRCILIAALFAFPLMSVAADDPADWPREYTHADGTVLLAYQPQLESWEQYRVLEARLAISVKKTGMEEPALGALQIRGSTEADFDTRRVLLKDVKITEVIFPALDAELTKAMEATVRHVFPVESVVIPLDALLANLEQEQAAVNEVKASIKPPALIFSSRDAVLVPLDGEAILEVVDGTQLMAVINTPSDLFRHRGTTQYYLRVGDGWMMAPELLGPWKPVELLPTDFARLPNTPGWKSVRASVPAYPISADRAPVVFVTTIPTELIVTEGKPRFTIVPGTKLYFAENTESDMFLYEPDGFFYVLVAGRWLRSAGGRTAVEYVKDLPKDFQRIPADHPAGRVLVSVPGTDQAREAVLAAQIPRIATVVRSEASVEVSYVGEPEFKQIADTRVAYAVNTSLDVFRVENRYYVCDLGVWFVGDSPTGPWVVADTVPDAIYTIPPSSPKYHVTYVTVYDSTPTYVYTGYTSGYLGAFVVGGLLVYALHDHRHHYQHYYHHHYRHYRNRRHAHRSAYHFRHNQVFRIQPYGHGRYYDHRSGSFRRAANVRRHHTAVGMSTGPYAAWNGKAVRASKARTSPVKLSARRPVRATVKRDAPDIYAGSKGSIYKRQANTWQRYDKGKWRAATTTPGPRVSAKAVAKRPDVMPRQVPGKPVTMQKRATVSRSTTTRSLNSAARGRSQGIKRSTQHQTYSKSRASSRAVRSSAGGRRR